MGKLAQSRPYEISSFDMGKKAIRVKSEAKMKPMSILGHHRQTLVDQSLVQTRGNLEKILSDKNSLQFEMMKKGLLLQNNSSKYLHTETKHSSDEGDVNDISVNISISQMKSPRNKAQGALSPYQPAESNINRTYGTIAATPDSRLNPISGHRYLSANEDDIDMG